MLSFILFTKFLLTDENQIALLKLNGKYLHIQKLPMSPCFHGHNLETLAKNCLPLIFRVGYRQAYDSAEHGR